MNRVFFKGIDWGSLAFLILLTLFAGNSRAETVCAQVKIEIKQELTLERQAFDAMMRINNGLDTLPINNVNVTVNFADEDGNSVLASSDPDNTLAQFFIRIDTMDNIADVSGYGSVLPSTTAEIHWLIIPAPGAAENNPTGKLYFVGATLDYTLGGEPESVTVTPDFITVKPLPNLTLDYFLTREVNADDPETPAIEPIEPYTLGVRVQNNGIAEARNLKIDSAQPKIIENEQGLLIGFEITGSSVDDQPSAPTLLIDFGTIAGNSSKVGRWDMISTLSGEFVEFTATFTHADELGGAL
ncbi:MAG: calcium-binding protein, partial [Candidatus Thiodiazotropha taylori]|nr:calcium-binding protein [Candidatus Thiodiazotropha taylori]MCW4258217.1 calcium-binding protein [Candidatus Thiodiazotropha taylori]